VRILTVLTYYRPHTSGLSIYAERLAKALVRRGHEVTVLSSQFDKSLPREEKLDGLRIVRLPVLFRVSKGVIMPSLGAVAWREMLKHDALLLHLPQFDAAGLALRGRLLKKATVIIYHSDLTLPPGLFNRFVNSVVHLMNNLAARFAHRISAYTEDFATHSPFLVRHAAKVKVISPAVEIPQANAADIEAFAKTHNPKKKHPVIGMATRFAAEKGVELLLEALPRVLEEHPDAMVLFAGQYRDVMGEEAYMARLLPTLKKFQAAGKWNFLDTLTMKEMALFYANIDLLVVPSTNSTETFGFVQIEAMMNGKPVVASNLPGVRQPVKITGMGRVSPVSDSVLLAKNMIAVLSDAKKYRGDSESLRAQFSPDASAERHEELFEEIARELENNSE
jgi:glycosyltransferase involved in cell wall biosynthesis